MNDKSITRSAPSALATLDAATQAKVVESLVLRGDMSGLGPLERARHYVHMCESLGLNPASQPFEYLRLNGKEILYAKRGATDQLAAIHKLDREIIDGPKVIDLAGTKLVYAVCRAKHPSGRVETSVATVPLIDPVNVLMKCETKAKRRATLSILGLGLLDESETESIPANAKEPGGGVDLRLLDAEPTVTAPPLTPAGYDLRPLGIERPQRAPREAVQTDDDPERAAIEAEAQHHDTTGADAAECLAADIRGIELPGEAVSVWMAHRKAVEALAPAERKAAWEAICAKVASVGKMNGTRAGATWLKRAVSEEDARRAAEVGA